VTATASFPSRIACGHAETRRRRGAHTRTRAGTFRNEVRNGQVVRRGGVGEKPRTSHEDPFGNTIRLTGTGTVARDNPFRFSTKRTDDNTDLVRYEYRAYSPSLGRWASRDPIGEAGAINLFQFVRNDPANLIDKDGQIIPYILLAGLAIYFSTEQYANAPGPDDPTYGGFTFDNVLAYADLGIVLSAKLVQGLARCVCKPVCSRLVPGGGLSAHEAFGGHTLARHVAQSGSPEAVIQAALAARLATDASIPAASTFASRAVAEKAILEALEANQGALCTWLSGSKARLVLSHVADADVGYVLARGVNSLSSSRELVIVLDKVAPQSGVCFRITTAYPK
jgi:RHS repeat-associated protein